MTGRYIQIKKRFNGLRCSAMIFPRMNRTMSTGTSVTERNAAAAIERVWVKASGLNKRPSCDSSVKIGVSDTEMISRLKNNGPPTWQAASTRT